MENKQTAIEWLKDKLPSIFIDDKNGFYRKLFEQALAMEKQQHGTTWDDALKQVEKRTVWARAMCDFDEYYEETYGN
jgi:hypothetical protein